MRIKGKGEEEEKENDSLRSSQKKSCLLAIAGR
jgi:hypothetical protein